MSLSLAMMFLLTYAGRPIRRLRHEPLAIEPEAGALAGVAAALARPHELLEHVRQNPGPDARPVVGDGEHDGGRLRPRLEPDARRGAAIAHRVSNEVCQHLIEEDWVRRRKGQPASPATSNACVAPRRLAVTTARSNSSRRSIQSRLISSAPASVAHHAVEALGFVLDLAEEVAPCRLRQSGAVVDEARRGAEDRGERGAEIMADRGQASCCGRARSRPRRGRRSPPQRAGRARVGPRLVPGTAGDRGGEDRNREQNEKRQELVRLGDREGVQRLDEKEVVAEEREC